MTVKFSLLGKLLNTAEKVSCMQVMQMNIISD